MAGELVGVLAGEEELLGWSHAGDAFAPEVLDQGVDLLPFGLGQWLWRWRIRHDGDGDTSWGPEQGRRPPGSLEWRCWLGVLHRHKTPGPWSRVAERQCRTGFVQTMPPARTP